MLEKLKAECLNTKETDPIAIAISLMRNPNIPMHGPIHHILDGAALLTALYNSGVKLDLAASLDEMARRGERMPGATCGNWGMCGAAASVGAALSILNGTGPLSSNPDYSNNLLLVSKALGNIAEVGGPRCCKRNAFLALSAAVELIKERYGIALPSGEIRCPFSAQNIQCKKESCPFYQRTASGG